MSLRIEFITLASKEGANISQLCQRFGISRRVGYKWLLRFRAEGLEGLKDRPRKPHRAGSKIPASLQADILQVRQEHRSWGARKIRHKLTAPGESPLPSASAITRLLHQHHQIDPRQAAAHRPFKRFEREQPNQLWQMDFKGHFALIRGGRCHPFTILDDCARFLLGLSACASQTCAEAQPWLEKAFRRYGLPEAILCDNGPPWGSSSGEYTQMGVWLLRLGIRLYHGRPLHPQTQGKCERFHRTLKAELLERADWLDLAHAQPRFDAFRDLYNLQRPHQALDMQVPASRYTPSMRTFPHVLPPLEYDEHERVRTVKSKGEITFQNRFFYVGRAFCGLPLALRPLPEPDRYHLCLGALPIGLVDLSLPNDRPKGNCFPLLPIETNLSNL